jgi:hypothetical protein
MHACAAARLFRHPVLRLLLDATLVAATVGKNRAGDRKVWLTVEGNKAEILE